MSKIVSHNNNTREFYRSREVAQEYEEIRFSSRGGKAKDKIQKEAVLSVLDDLSLGGSRILDVGCGTGRYSRLFSRKKARVISLDTSFAMLKKSIDKDSKSICVNADIFHLPFRDNSFDLAISIMVINHLQNHAEAIKEMCRTSRMVLIGVLNKHSILVGAYVYRFLRGLRGGYGGYTVKEYRNTPLPYSAYFSINELKKILRDNNFNNFKYKTCLFGFFVPGFLAPLIYRLDGFLSKYLRCFGAFLVISAEKYK